MQGLPLATQPTANADFEPLELHYYKGPVVAASWPAAVGLVLTLAVLLWLLLW